MLWIHPKVKRKDRTQEKKYNMSIIDPNILKSARKMRKDYHRMSASMSIYEKEVNELSKFYLKIASDLEEFNEEKVTEVSMKDTGKFLLSKMDELDVESKKLAIKIDPIAKKIEKIKDEWNTLYAVIKEKYPSMKDDEILKEIDNL
jgi:predicted  nucleic acid-binding Zn-ribbon protein